MRAVNLIPAEQRDGAGSVAGRSGGAALIVLTLLAALAVLAFVYGTSEHRISSSRNELATANAELSAVRAEVGRSAPYTSFIAMANQRTQEVSQLVASRFDWSHAFAELGRVLPRASSLSTLSGTVGSGGPGAATPTSAPTQTAAASGASATPPGSTPSFALSGCATSQSEVALTLQRLRLMDGVVEVTLQTSTKSAGGAAASGSSSAGSGAAGGCPPNGATFSAQVVFQPLPASSTTPAGPGASTPTGTPASTAGGQAGAVPVSGPGGGTSR
jgi:Tfp pilus assembly protein PilN